MKKPDEQKEFLGMPMSWDAKNMFQNLWNKETDEIVLPKKFGIGWTINFHAVLSRAGLIKKDPPSTKR